MMKKATLLLSNSRDILVVLLKEAQSYIDPT